MIRNMHGTTAAVSVGAAAFHEVNSRIRQLATAASGVSMKRPAPR
jgi:hypothetical protein